MGFRGTPGTLVHTLNKHDLTAEVIAWGVHASDMAKKCGRVVRPSPKIWFSLMFCPRDPSNLLESDRNDSSYGDHCVEEECPVVWKDGIFCIFCKLWGTWNLLSTCTTLELMSSCAHSTHSLTSWHAMWEFLGHVSVDVGYMRMDRENRSCGFCDVVFLCIHSEKSEFKSYKKI